jgi:hypothetical protein
MSHMSLQEKSVLFMFLFDEIVVDVIALKDRIIYKDSDNHGSFFFFSPKAVNSVAFYNGTWFKSFCHVA